MGQSTPSIGTGGRRPKCETRGRGQSTASIGTCYKLEHNL